MQRVVEFLQANPVQYLATVGRDGKAKCRPFMFCLEKDGKLWFCTNNQKDVYKDMQENPEIEVSIADAAFAWMRLHGKAVFEAVFYLEHPHGVIADFSGNPPYEF